MTALGTLPVLRPLSFALPAELEAPSPPEARGMTCLLYTSDVYKRQPPPWPA